MEDQIKFINIDDEERLEKIYDIVIELHSRETSGNCIVAICLGKSWVELCNEGIRLFQELKE